MNMIEQEKKLESLKEQIDSKKYVIKKYESIVDSLTKETENYKSNIRDVKDELEELEQEIKDIIGSPKYFIYDPVEKVPVSIAYFDEDYAKRKLNELDEPSLKIVAVWSK